MVLATQIVNAQKIHVHNDYKQRVPFWGAVSSGADQVEADVFLKKGKLFIAHEESSIKKSRTLHSLYLQPIEKAFELGLINKTPFNVLVDIKSEPYSTLEALKKVLDKFFEKIDDKKVKIIVSGRRPKQEDYIKYPDYILFDCQEKELPKDKKIRSKIAMVSYSFKEFSVWNGKGKIVADEYKKLQKAIKKAHKINKPIRFWATPDSKSAWKALSDMKVDFINTDKPKECVDYIKSLPKRWFKNTVFSKVYKPTFKSDNKDLPVENIILMVGDGNGLTQISSAALANGGDLTLMQLKSTGFMKTQSSDDFTTDSAASGTALATGKKTYNRAIGVDAKGNKAENIAEFLHKQNYNTACITTDEIFGATPSAFYAHQKDRGYEDEIAKELLTSKFTLFAGGGSKKYTKKELEKHNFKVVNSIDEISNSKAEKIGYFLAKGGVPSVEKGRGNALAEITKNSLTYLKNKNKPFFAMIESSHIDTYGHHNSVSGVVTEAIDFDRAITEAIKFADKNKKTLVIVLADHETAGFSIPQGNVKTNHIEGSFYSDDHTGVMVPVFAYGPKSYEFEGCYENSDVYGKILKVLGLK